MAEIKIDPAVLEKGVEDIGRYIGDLSSVVESLGNLKGLIESTWSGDSGNAFINKLGEQIGAGELIGQMLEDYKNFIDQANKDFKEADHKAAQNIRSSF